MSKIVYKEALKTTTMFLCDSKIEAYYENYLNSEVKQLKEKLSGIETSNGLKSFIHKDRDSIEKIITLLGISGEKFKRVVSWIRLNKGYTFESEWSTKKLRSELISNPSLMEEYCELFASGYVSSKFSAIVPKFILHDFRIDNNTIERLKNDDYIRNLIKDKITTSYNIKYRDLYLSKLDNKIRQIVDLYGLEFGKKDLPHFSNKQLTTISLGDKHIIINSSFYLTTSSKQTTYYKVTIQPIVQDSQADSNTLVINILDGAGWIARNSDFKKVFRDCDYYLNLKTIDNLNIIIKEFFKID
ncbi:DpnII restriction endonuclease [Leeuwenhoekiella aestuarii]|uniref:DpnII family type II restriction endonuclease n=1 Tax=Leeuwenhoekiella aestuarii TaxID=2249426 RepID=UPI000FFEE619|nr:DpnII family type II restriction endonuclease [Leeuwenhoekiella aestuarii]RXG19123.1 DpnII restriction endonuclease [Leeuwenhoekiella aestuarii]